MTTDDPFKVDLIALHAQADSVLEDAPVTCRADLVEANQNIRNAIEQYESVHDDEE